MRKSALLASLAILLAMLNCRAVAPPATQLPVTLAAPPPPADWTRTARIATPYDYPDSDDYTWEENVDRAVADGATVILDWHYVSGDWRYLYEPGLSDNIAWMQQCADYVHTYPGVRYIIYVAPLEYVTEGVDVDQDGEVDAGKEEDSLALQHSDWIQVGIDGRSAAFYGAYPGMPFWVCETCEDMWVTPANPEYRALALDQARAIATSGIDGVWFDVPFLRYDFGDNWQDQWPDVSTYARQLFQQQTGYTLPAPPFTPDWNDTTWLAFVAWRYQLIREFVADYYAALQEANPDIRLIMETSVGLEPSSTRMAASPLDLPAVSDLTAHEYTGPETSVQYYEWLVMLAELVAWRHVDGDAPSWLLSYVEAGHSDTADVAQLHGALVTFAGFNYYTSGGEDMATLVDAGFRRQLFAWIEANEGSLYDPYLRPYANVAVVYSQQTLDYRSRASWEEGDYSDGFFGLLMLLLESHIPFQVISERELSRLSEFDVAILPSFEAMSTSQSEAIRAYVQAGGRLIATGETSRYTEQGQPRDDFLLADVFGVGYNEAEEGEVYVNGYGTGRSVFTLTPHEQWYFWAAEPWWGGTPDPAGAEAERLAFLDEVWTQAEVVPVLETDAPRSLIALPLRRVGGVDVRLVNLTGIGTGDAVPVPQSGVALTLTLPSNAPADAVSRLEYLGAWAAQPYTQPSPLHIRATCDVYTGTLLYVETRTAEVYLPVVVRVG
jgi:hypothetical protein